VEAETHSDGPPCRTQSRALERPRTFQHGGKARDAATHLESADLRSWRLAVGPRIEGRHRRSRGKRFRRDYAKLQRAVTPKTNFARVLVDVGAKGARQRVDHRTVLLAADCRGTAESRLDRHLGGAYYVAGTGSVGIENAVRAPGGTWKSGNVSPPPTTFPALSKKTAVIVLVKVRFTPCNPSNGVRESCVQGAHPRRESR
jgi:hypothetical protein